MYHDHCVAGHLCCHRVLPSGLTMTSTLLMNYNISFNPHVGNDARLLSYIYFTPIYNAVNILLSSLLR